MQVSNRERIMKPVRFRTDRETGERVTVYRKPVNRKTAFHAALREQGVVR